MDKPNTNETAGAPDPPLAEIKDAMPQSTNEDIESTVSTAPASRLNVLQYLPAFTKREPSPEFPPRSWTDEGLQYGGTEGSESVPFYPTPAAVEEENPPSVPPPAAEAESTAAAPDRSQLANRIRQLVGLLPADPSAATEERSPTVYQMVDERMRSLLTSETVMNGVKGVPSVWTLLDRMRPTKASATDEGKQEDTKPDGIMMYTPLHPDNSSEPELASVAESVEEDKETKETSDKGKKLPGSKKGEKHEKVWVPSLEKISIEARYWGFRIYLPPPVMASLDAAQPFATKQAAIITTALKWTLDKIPLALAPPTLRPAFMVLKRLVPYVGSIGIFVSWSWSAIKKHDKGKGVVLTASWLLPVALVPSSWPESPEAVKERDEATAAPKPQNEPPISCGFEPPKEETKEGGSQVNSSWSNLWKGKEKAV